MGKIPYKDLSKEMKRLKQTLKNIPEDRRPIGESLFDELAFMDNTLATLRAQVNKGGANQHVQTGETAIPARASCADCLQ